MVANEYSKGRCLRLEKVCKSFVGEEIVRSSGYVDATVSNNYNVFLSHHAPLHADDEVDAKNEETEAAKVDACYAQHR